MMLRSGKERILVIAPHCDDEVIGCGGLMYIAKKYDNQIKVVIGAVGDTKFYHLGRVVTAKERKQELEEALKSLGLSVQDLVILYEHMEGKLDTLAIQDVISRLDAIIFDFKPTMVFIPLPSFHQDHKIIHEASFASLRPSSATTNIRMVAAYEYPLTAWGFANESGGKMYLDISDCMEKKLNALKMHKSQLRDNSHPLSPEAVQLWAQRRGLECGCLYAEAFFILRSMLD